MAKNALGPEPTMQIDNDEDIKPCIAQQVGCHSIMTHYAS